MLREYATKAYERELHRELSKLDESSECVNDFETLFFGN